MNFDEELEKALSETIFWHDTIDQFLRKEKKHKDLLKRLENSYPRVLYEASFLTGDRNWYDQALSRDPSLSPEERSCVTTAKIEKNKENRHEVHIHEPTTFVKEPEYISWQRWRSTSLNNEHYPHPEFPTFFERVFVYINEGMGKLRANNQLKISATGELKVAIDDIPHRISYLILNQTALPNICGHRYEYELLFDQLVPEDVAEQIMGVPSLGNK